MKAKGLIIAAIIMTAGLAYSADLLFMQIDGIPGESTDGNHLNWIDVQSFSHGVQFSGSGPASHSSLTVSYLMDKSAPVLNIRACDQLPISSVLLEAAQEADSSKETYQVELGNATVAAVSTASDTNGTALVFVSFDFETITWTYTPYSSGGSPGLPVSACWNLDSNSACP